MITWAVAIALFGGIIYLAAQHVRPLLYDYRASDDALDFVILGRFRVYRVRLYDVIDIEKLRPLQAATSWLWPWEMLYIVNRLFASYIAVRRTEGPALVITPANGDAFLRDLRGRWESRVSSSAEPPRRL
jgi:hypothetical protein